MPSTMSKAFKEAADREVCGALRDIERRNWQEGQIMKDGWSAIGRRPGKHWEEELDKRLPFPPEPDGL